MKVLGFGIVREIFGAGSAEVAAMEGISIETLKTKLEDQYPRLKQLSSFAIAINGEYATPGAVINAGDEIAIIPPVSGG